MYEDNEKKFTVVVNPRHPTGTLLNALGHALVGLAADLGSSECELLDYRNDAGRLQARISRYPVIVLRAKNGNQLRTAYHDATHAGVSVNAFVTAMVGESTEKQILQTANAEGDELSYVAVALFGSAESLKPLTKRFSLLSSLS